MYICMCNGHDDRAIRDAVRQGARCATDAYHMLGKPPRCGRCLEFADELVSREAANVGDPGSHATG
jgi:bacterioferritin-associated ferredoxin